jgi:hypothetical protein
MEIIDIDKFVQLSEKASYCNVKRLKDVVKIKIRTPRTLYTLKVNFTKVDEIIKKLHCEINEI